MDPKRPGPSRPVGRGGEQRQREVTAPQVSVLMTAYNRERYIAAAIESVLAQTFTDFELVIVDDLSTDDTVKVAGRYLSDPRVRLIVNEKNLGDYPNRNHAASFALGEFLKYHDSDDRMYPHCLEVLVRCLRAHTTAAFALSASHAWPGSPVPVLLTPRLSYLREYVGIGMFHVGPACALFRRAAFDALGRFRTSGVHSDLLFWLHACARVDVVLAPGDLFWYRVHEGQELSRGGGYEFARLERARWEALFASDCPLNAAERQLARRNQAGGIIKRLIADLRAGAWALAWYRWRHSGLSAADWLQYGRRPRRRNDAGSPPFETGSGAASVPAVTARVF
jgi:glycosyltransferase involved in cell wall biosynthesis